MYWQFGNDLNFTCIKIKAVITFILNRATELKISFQSFYQQEGKIKQPMLWCFWAIHHSDACLRTEYKSALKRQDLWEIREQALLRSIRLRKILLLKALPLLCRTSLLSGLLLIIGASYRFLNLKDIKSKYRRIYFNII